MEYRPLAGRSRWHDPHRKSVRRLDPEPTGVPPRVDLAAERALASVLVAAREQGLAAAAHDLSEGGLVQGLLEASLRFGVGTSVALDGVTGRDGVSPFAALFSETTARALVAVDPSREAELVDVAEAAGVPVLRLGTTGGDALAVAGGFDGESFEIALADAREAHEGTLPRLFG
jgi:phosphoribosylformylglycinamidine synthase